MRFKSIAARIYILVLPTILVTLVTFSFLSYVSSNERINSTINEKMQESLHLADMEIQLELQKNAAVAMNFASYGKTMRYDTFDAERHEGYLAEGVLSNGNTFGGGVWFEPYAFDPDAYYFGPFLYVEEGEQIIYVPEYGEHVDYYNEDWYVKGKAANGQLIWSSVYYDPVSTITMVTASKAFFDYDGEFLGMGTADMSLEKIGNIVNAISIGETGRAFIIGANGEYISFFDASKSAQDTIVNDADPELARLGGELLTNGAGSSSFLWNGKRQRVYYTTMENVNWTLVVTVEESEINSTTLSSFLSATIIPAVGLLLVILGIYMVILYLREIITKVNSFADLAASGDFLKRIEVTETDEFGVMEERLNRMIANMEEMSGNSARMLQIAENASKAKSEFLSRMSHEIRSPMNAIIGMTQIAISSEDGARVTDCLHKIDGASKHLLALINDILDMSKIEADKLELSEDEFDPEDALRGVCNMMLVKAEEKELALTVHVEPNVPAVVIGDELRFSQIVTNLLGNAVKFTPEQGSIEVRMREAEQDDTHSVLEVSVRDSGIGMTMEQQERLFRSFEQGDGSISRRFGGSGLGLAISKKLVDKMGGRIWVVSEPDKGSEFTFTIRAARGLGGHPEEQQSADLSHLKILVVDDSVEANEYMTHILHMLTLSCDNAYNGYEALKLVKQRQAANEAYDIIFMDYMMPKLNGVEAAESIRRITRESTAVIMVSIYDRADIQEAARNAGIAKFLTKPFTPSTVYDSILEVSRAVPKRVAIPPAPPMLSFREHTILLAEDIDINREIVAAFLEQTEVAIAFAENGLQAVEMFRAEPERYDVILMDIQMPEMDGFEATRQIRAMDIKRAKTIPILAMTANALSEDVEKCTEAGMNGHLAKPISPETLLLKLNDCFFMKDYLNRDIN